MRRPDAEGGKVRHLPALDSRGGSATSEHARPAPRGAHEITEQEEVLSKRRYPIGRPPKLGDPNHDCDERDRVHRERLDRLGLRFEQVLSEFVGASATHGPLAGADAGRSAPEIQYRIGVRDSDKSKVERFTREIVPLVLNLPRFLSDIGLEICRRWFPDLVPEQYRRKPE